MTAGFLAMPINLPGTALNKAARSRDKIVDYLTDFAKKSKTSMRAKHQPNCLLDFWVPDYKIIFKICL